VSVHVVKAVPGPLERALEWTVVMIGLVWLFVYAWVHWSLWPRRPRLS
jgi:hypothetical protein